MLSEDLFSWAAVSGSIEVAAWRSQPWSLPSISIFYSAFFLDILVIGGYSVLEAHIRDTGFYWAMVWYFSWISADFIINYTLESNDLVNSLWYLSIIWIRIWDNVVEWSGLPNSVLGAIMTGVGVVTSWYQSLGYLVSRVMSRFSRVSRIGTETSVFILERLQNL